MSGFYSMDKFNNTELPPKEAFYSKLKQSSITDEEYKQGLDSWNNTGRKTIGDYMMLYL